MSFKISLIIEIRVALSLQKIKFLKCIIIINFLIKCTIFSACSIFKKQTLYNTYLVKHRKYNMKQIFSYPYDVNLFTEIN
jgi:hypothetical protein